ncbi:hypothetical protein [uncultured Duncaniella sp.]|uniref:hypothetical protein n=1 Tax=uncultured Duncaniella sp. TaxID=2768039 RepID=UPI00272AC176|nr:hypothetical protein [uncultured Duncaniella sp.]
MKLLTIQTIYACHRDLHDYLKSQALNNNEHIFFRHAEKNHTEIYMLNSNGQFFHIVKDAETFRCEPAYGTVLLTWAIQQARFEVAGRHPYLRNTLEKAESALGLRPSNALF